MQNAWKKLYTVSLLSLFLVSTLGKAESSESFFKKSLKTLRLHRKKAIFAVAVVALGGVAYWKRDAIADCWNSFRGKNENKGLNSSENNKSEIKDVSSLTGRFLAWWDEWSVEGWRQLSEADPQSDKPFSMPDFGCLFRDAFSTWVKKKNQECSKFPSGAINIVNPCGDGGQVALSDFFSRISRSARDTFKEYKKSRYENSSPEVYRLHKRFAGGGLLDSVNETDEAVIYLEKLPSGSGFSTNSADYVSQAKELFKDAHEAMVRMRRWDKANESFWKKEQGIISRFTVESEDKKEDWFAAQWKKCASFLIHWLHLKENLDEEVVVSSL